MFSAGKSGLPIASFGSLAIDETFMDNENINNLTTLIFTSEDTVSGVNSLPSKTTPMNTSHMFPESVAEANNGETSVYKQTITTQTITMQTITTQPFLRRRILRCLPAIW